MTLLVAIVALCVVIMIHELGHYLAAVATGMKVDRFSVFGIGPAIIKFGTWRGTEFVISAIPFGAYVLIRGMEPEDEDAREQATGAPAGPSHNFRDKSVGARALVLAGGPLANYLTAFLLYFGVFALAGLKGPVEAIEIAALEDDAPALVAGLEPGDELVRIGDAEIDPAASGQDVMAAAEPLRGQEAEVTVRRNGELLTKTVPIAEDGAPLPIAARSGSRIDVGVGRAAMEAVNMPLVVTGAQLKGLYLLITGQLKADMQGPVGIVQHIAASVDAGIVPFILTTALISTLLGMFNLLPMPALDGGRLAFIFYEAVARRRANPRVEEMVHGYGMLALLGLILLITVGDVRRLFE